MPRVRSTSDTISILRELFAQEDFQQGILRKIDPEREDILRDDLEQTLMRTKRSIVKVMDEFNQFPPQHIRHSEILAGFHDSGEFNKSIFIMTKFPDGRDPEADSQLKRVIDAARQAIEDCAFVPRVADTTNRFHTGVWDNVELHLLGCKKGLAILEDRYRRELNPNVAMEWGWMRALGRDVLYLREMAFSQERADISGLITAEFSWDIPEPGISEAVGKWLKQPEK